MSIAILAAVAADRLVGDPPTKYHPVAWFGNYVTAVEKVLYGDSKLRGVGLLAATVVPVMAVPVVVGRKYPTAALAVSLYCALGGTTLERIGMKMHDVLAAGDLEAARELVPWLCSRDPEALDEAGIVRATVESLAENTSDAAIVPILFAPFGAPLVVLHRTVNTLDAMVGYRNERYENFGWAAAKLDDVLAYVPARVTAALHMVQAFAAGRGGEAVRAWREDAHKHPSPNAGPVESTAAAALGVKLGGATQYSHGVEMRPELSNGRAPEVADIAAAVRLSRITQAAAVALACVVRRWLA